jgi:hypothetical protein
MATDLLATLSKLHRNDCVQGYLAVPISVATLHEFARYSGHKASNGLPGNCKALRFGPPPLPSISIVSGKSLIVVLQRRIIVIHEGGSL